MRTGGAEEAHHHINIVGGGRLDLLELIGLDLKRHKLFELPVLVREEMRVPALEDALLAIVLRHRRVALIDGHEGVRPEGDQVVIECDLLLEEERLGAPDMNAWR